MTHKAGDPIFALGGVSLMVWCPAGCVQASPGYGRFVQKVRLPDHSWVERECATCKGTGEQLTIEGRAMFRLIEQAGKDPTFGPGTVPSTVKALEVRADNLEARLVTLAGELLAVVRYLGTELAAARYAGRAVARGHLPADWVLAIEGAGFKRRRGEDFPDEDDVREESEILAASRTSILAELSAAGGPDVEAATR